MGDEAERASLAGDGGTGPVHARPESPGLGRRLVGFLGMLILGACFCAPAYWAGVIALRAERFGFGPVAMGAVALGLFGIGSALALWGVHMFRSPRPGPDYETVMRKRAAALGLPAEPEAYQDGGLGVAATAWRLDEAELIAAMLRGQGIAAWVEGAATAGWYWHLQFALHPGGIRILVPMGRLADAQAIIAEHSKERAAQPGAEPGVEAEAEPVDPGAALHQSARRLAYLLLIGPIALVVFVLAIRLLVKIRRQRLATGPTDELRRARRLALVTAVLAGPGWGAFFGVVCISTIRSL